MRLMISWFTFMQAHGLAEYIAQVRRLTIHVIGCFHGNIEFK